MIRKSNLIYLILATLIALPNGLVFASNATSTNSDSQNLSEQVKMLQKEVDDLRSKLKTEKIQTSYPRVLKKGRSGDDVKQLQEFLKAAGAYPNGEVTGYFGKKTEEAVKLFQKNSDIETTGIFGTKTRAAVIQNVFQKEQAMSSSDPVIVGAVLSDGITSDGGATSANTNFASTTPDIYAVLDLKNVTETTQLSYARFYNDSYIDSGVSHPTKANVSNFHFQWSLKPNSTRTAGDYSLKFYVNGKRMTTVNYSIY